MTDQTILTKWKIRTNRNSGQKGQTVLIEVLKQQSDKRTGNPDKTDNPDKTVLTNSRDNRKSCQERQSCQDKRDSRVKRESRGVTAQSTYQEGLAFSRDLYTNAERIATEHSYSFLQQRVQIGKTSVLTESILCVCVCVCARARARACVRACARAAR